VFCADLPLPDPARQDCSFLVTFWGASVTFGLEDISVGLTLKVFGLDQFFFDFNFLD